MVSFSSVQTETRQTNNVSLTNLSDNHAATEISDTPLEGATTLESTTLTRMFFNSSIVRF